MMVMMTVIATWMILWLVLTRLARFRLRFSVMMTLLATRMIQILVFTSLAELWVIHIEPAFYPAWQVFVMATTVWPSAILVAFLIIIITRPVAGRLRSIRLVLRLSTRLVAIIVVVVARLTACRLWRLWNRWRCGARVWPLNALENAGLEVIDTVTRLDALAWETAISFFQHGISR